MSGEWLLRVIEKKPAGGFAQLILELARRLGYFLGWHFYPLDQASMRAT
jgi:hypothetical protein